MNLAIEFHDSKLTSMAKLGDSIELRFHAYIHASEGTPGVNAGKGWYQDVLVVVTGGVVQGQVTNWPAELYDGMLEVDGEAIDNVVPLPLERSGSILLRLDSRFYEDGPLLVLGSRVRFELLPGAPSFIEDFPGV